MSKKQLEVRTSKIETRVKKADDGTPHLEGYAAVFNQETDLGSFHEIIAPGAFKRCLSENPDVPLIFNHDPNYILGRTISGTLALTEDARGLKFDVTLPGGPMAGHVAEAVARGDVDGASFAFAALEESWSDVKDAAGRVVRSVRTIMDADLFDVSPCVFPAYGGTSVAFAVRALWPNGMPQEIRRRHGVEEAVDTLRRQAGARLRVIRASLD